MVEYGHARFRRMNPTFKSHSNLYGDLLCMEVSMVRPDAASIWAEGRRPPDRRGAKDTYLCACGLDEDAEGDAMTLDIAEN